MNISWGLFTNPCNNCIPNMFSFMFTVFLIGCVVFWIYKLVTYDWSKYDEDSKDDDFFKPYD